MADTPILHEQGSSTFQELAKRGSNKPCALVWCPLPPLTWVVPVIGHVGMTDSRGIVHDFADTIHTGPQLVFDKVAKYVSLNPEGVIPAEQWDKALTAADETYKQRTHNLLTNNCHHHVARALNEMRYRGKTNWNAWDIGILTMTKSHYVSTGRVIKTWAPFLGFLAVVGVFAFVGVYYFG